MNKKEMYNSIDNQVTPIWRRTAKSIELRTLNEGAKGKRKSAAEGSAAVEEISSLCWFDIGCMYGNEYNFDVSVLKGRKSKILCRKSDIAFADSHVDVRVFMDDEFIHGEECKTFIDVTQLERTFAVADRMRNDTNYYPSISMLALLSDINEFTMNYFIHDDIIDDINFLGHKKRKKETSAWIMPFNESQLYNYFDYISGVYEKNIQERI